MRQNGNFFTFRLAVRLGMGGSFTQLISPILLEVVTQSERRSKQWFQLQGKTLGLGWGRKTWYS